MTGSKGQLGRELQEQGRVFAFDIIGIDIAELDITSIKAVETYFEGLDVCAVINAAAYTAVDKAESEPETAFAVNEKGPANLAFVCDGHGIPLIHISTDYVFDGTKNGPYKESDPVSPKGVYAQSKAAGEKEVIKRATHCIVVRTAWLYGVYGDNFVKTMLKLAREKRDIRVVSDQKGCPTYAKDLAGAVLNICRQLQSNQMRDPWGVYHYCGKGETNWYAFAEKAIALAEKYEKMVVRNLTPIPTEEYPTPAPRPGNSVLNCQKIEKVFGLKRNPWEKDLESMLERLYTATNNGPKLEGIK